MLPSLSFPHHSHVEMILSLVSVVELSDIESTAVKPPTFQIFSLAMMYKQRIALQLLPLLLPSTGFTDNQASS